MRVGLSSLENNENATRSYSKDELNGTFIQAPAPIEMPSLATIESQIEELQEKLKNM